MFSDCPKFTFSQISSSWSPKLMNRRQSLLPPFSTQGMGNKAQDVLHTHLPRHALVLICVMAKDGSRSSRILGIVRSTWKPFQWSTGPASLYLVQGMG